MLNCLISSGRTAVHAAGFPDVITCYSTYCHAIAAAPQVAIRTTHWTVINHALIWGTLLLWLPFLALLSGLCGSVAGLAPLCGLHRDLMGSGSFWLSAVFGAPAAALLLDYTIMVFQRLFRPRASQLLQVGRGMCEGWVQGGG